MKDSSYTIFYAAVMGGVCALLLTGVGRFAAPYREANAKADEVRSILNVLQVPFDLESSSKELVKIFEGNVRIEERGDLTLYLYVGPGVEEKVRAVAVPFAGTGLWGPVEGFLALEPDMKTILSVTFHKQEETPGLGGEIASSRFRDQFEGKSIIGADGEPGIRMRRGGEALASNEVHAITGATMTSDRVERMLNAVIHQIAQEHIEHVQ